MRNSTGSHSFAIFDASSGCACLIYLAHAIFTTFHCTAHSGLLHLVRFFQKFLQKIFPKFFQYFFRKFLPKFFPKLRHTASTMVSLVPRLGSRKFATQVVYLSLASLGLVAANSRLHASFTFYVRNPNLVRFFQNFFQNFSKIFSKIFPNIFFKNFCRNIFQNCDTRLLQWYLWSLGSVAANSRLRLCTCPLRLWAW